jgi:hypothetical protein
MKVENLNEKINQLATHKSRLHVERITKAVDAALEKECHGQKSGDGTWFGDTAKAVLTEILRTWGSGRGERRRVDSLEIEEYYRAKILDELLEKLPLVRELVSMQEFANEQE